MIPNLIDNFGILTKISDFKIESFFVSIFSNIMDELTNIPNTSWSDWNSFVSNLLLLLLLLLLLFKFVNFISFTLIEHVSCLQIFIRSFLIDGLLFSTIDLLLDLPLASCVEIKRTRRNAIT